MILFQIPPPRRIGQLLVTIWTCAFLTACGVTERISTSREVKVDSVRHEVPLPGHVFERRLVPADSIFLENDRLKISIWKQPRAAAPAESAAPQRHRLSVSGADSGLTDSALAADFDWMLRAEVKPETVRVTVPQKTITEKKETLRYVPKTPGYVKYIIGGLVMLILILLVAWRLTK